MPITKKKMSKCIQAGRTAIEYRMLGVLLQTRAGTETDDAEMGSLSELYKQYNALLSPYEQPRSVASAATVEAANEEKGAQQ